MGFGAAVASCFNKYATFSGRAPRSEYWWWLLFCILIELGFAIVGGIIDAGAGSKAPGQIVTAVLELALLLPSLAVAFRRLHDLNRSGWWYGAMMIIWLFLIFLAIPSGVRMHENQLAGYAPNDGIPPFVLPVVVVLGIIEVLFGLMLFIWFCMRGTRGQNRFGADPLKS
jgi:uncharacterized membrane protein YhaH (DUF805 family)